MTENEIAKIVVDVGYNIHKKLGPGLLESVYQKIMAYELRRLGLSVEEELPIAVFWDEKKMDVGFRADLTINRKLIVELKSVEKTHPVHAKTLLTYLKAADYRLGLLMNFGEVLMKTGITRVVNGLKE